MARLRLQTLTMHLLPDASLLPLSALPTAADPASMGPLSGYRILDLSQMLSGPMCCQILGDQGADVIKVEPLEGDQVRSFARQLSPVFSIINRNKRSVAIDLKKDEGRKLLLELAKTADVVVQNFRPSAAEKLGIGYEDIRKIKPDIVYLSISGFGDIGPYSDHRVYDPIIQAVTGLTSVQADESGRPRMMRLIIPDKVTSVTASQAVTAALLQREKTGRGQHVKLSMLDAVLSFMWPEGMAAHTFIDGKAAGNDQRHAYYSRDLIFDTNDGYITIATNTMKEWKGLCAALDKPEWLTDSRFRDGAALNSNRGVRLELVASEVRTLNSSDAIAKLQQHSVPCAPVNHPRSRVIDDPQVKALGSVLEAEHPLMGKMRFARPAAQFNNTFELKHHAPLIGEQTNEVLQEIGVDSSRLQQLRAAGVLRKEPGLH